MINYISHLPQLAVSIFIFFLGVVVIKNNHKASTNIGFFALSVTTAMWLFTYYFAYNATSHVAHFLFKLGFSFVIFMGVAAYHFSTSYAGFTKELRFVKAGYLIATTFLFALWSTDHVITQDLYKYSWGYYPQASILHAVFLLFVATMLIRFNMLLYKKYLRAKIEKDELEAIRTKYVFWAIFLFCLAPIDFIPNYGYSIYPISFLFAAIYSTIMAYSIMKHQLMDIEVIIRRTAVFAGLFAFVYGTFTLITVLGQDLFKNHLGWNQWISTAPMVAIIIFALRPLDNLLTNLTDRFLFQKKYDYRELLRTFTNEVLTILDLQKLTEQTIADLMKIIKLESATILLLDDETRDYKIAASSGIKDKAFVFKKTDTLITYLKQSSQPLIKDKEAEAMEGHSTLREDFKRLYAQLCLPIAHHDELLGVLCLGMKKSGEEFTPEDIDILMTLARTEGIAIANAQLFDQLSKTQAEAAQREKMAVIGTLAAGINHEICNPLGIVRGQCEMFLLNLRDGIYSEKSKEDLIKISTEIMNKVIRETDRATTITKRLSGFAKPAKKMDSEEVAVEKETDEVMGLVGHDLKLSNIEFNKNFELGFPTILADRRQIQEVLFNIIRNAAQAMDKKDGKITLSGTSANGMAVIKIVDNGSGIPKDKIGQIFNPFFTTKEPGKGTGLGLFIVRQVVERNHGTIAVDSEDGVGTTFTLTFPATASAKAIAA